MICGELTGRLASAAQLVRQGASFADIGTDHAYLPIFLLKTGHICHAVCSDVNEGPLNSARRNAADSGVEDRIDFILADGAAALAGRGITDYAICGMGGELIAGIIDRAPHLKDGSLSLVLQPMTRHAHLRRYLASRGFRIRLESYTREAGKLYVCMLVVYDGERREISDVEAELGEENCEIVNVGLQLDYFKDKIRALSNIVDGKIRGGDTSPSELSLLSAAVERVKKLEALLLP